MTGRGACGRARVVGRSVVACVCRRRDRTRTRTRGARERRGYFLSRFHSFGSHGRSRGRSRGSVSTREGARIFFFFSRARGPSRDTARRRATVARADDAPRGRASTTTNNYGTRRDAS